LDSWRIDGSMDLDELNAIVRWNAMTIARITVAGWRTHSIRAANRRQVIVHRA
jgi:hypothetical protein